ncbi:S-Ena type endospore appendage [Chengkuizengella marina]|uniref:Endospore appendages core domain-containing protein n=1 Tax=Chengkuizengella marina TaxID=2507566 RepID=A0A6N9Q191_9BACL|nr:S-Ena type endospore appendage [Chengkuizengella marina]NBI29016.1 hypothetical protein [Chengkuizengella marina]
MSCYSSKSDVCCPISCAGIELIPKQLILIKRCTPIRNPCDDATVATLFTTEISTTSSQLPKGIITIVNTSTDCTMDVNVTENGNAAVPYTVLAQSSINIEVNNLVLVDLTCTGPVTTDFCTGTFDADLQYSINK